MGKRERILGGLGALLVLAYLVIMPGYLLQQPRDWTLKKTAGKPGDPLQASSPCGIS